jgi:RecB family exonuclease
MLIKGKFLKVVSDVDRQKYFGLSVSKAKTFKQCKAKYHFNYIQKLPRKEWDHLTFGKFLHEVLERFVKYILGTDFDGNDVGPNELPDHLLMKKCFSEALVEWGSKLSSEDKKLSFDILCTYLKQRADKKAAGTMPQFIQAEKPFNIDIGEDILMNGYIDLVQIDPDGMIHVADYKTSKSMTWLKKDWLQLKVYAYVMCIENPDLQKVRCSYIMLRHDFKSIVKEFSRADVMGMEQEFRDYAENIGKEKLFRATPSGLCAYCDYQDHCIDGREYLENKNGIVKQSSFGAVGW